MPDEPIWPPSGGGVPPHTPTAGLSSELLINGSTVAAYDRKLNVIDTGYMVQGSVSDQHAGLLAAITEANIAQCGLYLPRGTYHMGSSPVVIPAVSYLEIEGETSWHTGSSGGTLLTWDNDPGGALFATVALDGRSVTALHVKGIDFRGPARFAPANGVVCNSMVALGVINGSMVEACRFEGWGAGISRGGQALSSDHSAVEKCFMQNVGVGLLWPGVSNGGGDEHLRKLWIQANCAGFAFALGSNGLIGSGATDVDIYAPISFFRYDDGSATSTHNFLNLVGFGGHCSTEYSGTATIFDELYTAAGTNGGIVSNCQFSPSIIWQAPSASQRQWQKAFAVTGNTANTITVTDNAGFWFRKGMAVTVGAGGSVPAGTTVTAISGSWPWGSVTLTLSNTVTGTPTTATIGQPILGAIVAAQISNNAFPGAVLGSGSNGGFPILYSGAGPVQDNTFHDFAGAQAAAANHLVGGAYPVINNTWGAGKRMIISEYIGSGQSCAAGDLLIRWGGDGLAKYGTSGDVTRPVGIALNAAGSHGPVDYVPSLYDAFSVTGVTANNHSGTTAITAGANVYADAANPGGITSTAPASGWIYPIGSAENAIPASSSGVLRELWL